MPATFIVDVIGEFHPGQVRIVWRDEPRRPDARVDALVADTWAQWQRDCERRGQRLFNGQLVRYLRHRVVDGVLEIEAGPTDYANFIGTNFANGSRGEELCWDLFSNPIGISANVITSDGWLLYGRRGQRVACHQGYVHTFGGGMEAEERRPDGSHNPFDGIRRELREELSVSDAEISRLVCLGIVRDVAIGQPELIFDAHLLLSRELVEQRLRKDDEEHDAIESCRNEPQAVLPFIRSLDLVAPAAVAAICLHGRYAFGAGWYERALKHLSETPS